MRLSEFWTAMDDEFGSYGRVISHDVVLGRLDGLTAEEAIAAGVSTREIWLAVCDVQDVPHARRYGVGQREPRN